MKLKIENKIVTKKVGKQNTKKKSIKTVKSKKIVKKISQPPVDDFVDQDFEDENLDHEEMSTDEINDLKNLTEIAGNSEDEEDEKTSVVKNAPVKITIKMLQKWEQELTTDKTSKTIKNVMETFQAVAIKISKLDNAENSLYKVETSRVFNGVLELCIQHLPEALKKFLNIIHDGKFEASKAKRFPKIKNTLNIYLMNLINILQTVTSSDVVVLLLKHLHCVIQYSQSFPTLNKPLFNALVKLWSTGDEEVQVNAFINIIKITTSWKDAILENLLEIMYTTYYEKSNLVTPDSLSGINFMRQSLAEIYLLDQNIAYNHAFMHIRQLALKLRNATTLKNKENIETVYSWQFVNSLRLWSELVTHTKKQSVLRPLLYPLVQILIASIKLIPTSEFYPLRFHYCQILINISKETGTFIPVLPYLLDVLKFYDFNKTNKTVSIKQQISFAHLLKINKSELNNNVFNNAIFDNVYQLILENSAKDSSAIYFPDLYINCIIEIKAFLLKCKIPSYNKKMKQLLEKIQENRQFVETERNKIIVDLSDSATILNWEIQLRTRGTPLQNFYDNIFNKKN